MNQLAEHILAVAHENNNTVTNLHLQKIMYFTLQRALNNKLLNYNELLELYDQHFLVWRYGPVIPTIYKKYSLYSASPIMISGYYSQKLSPLDNAIEELLNTNPFRLVNQSHSEPFWKNHQREISGWRSEVEYTLKDVEN